MNITPKQYAESLYQAVADKKSREVKGVIENFIKVLADNNNISKIDKIIEQFVKIWNEEEKIVEAEITSAKELDNKIIKLLYCYIVKLSGAKKVVLKQKVDKNVLGGVVIKYEDRVLDGSLRMRLNELKEKMVK